MDGAGRVQSGGVYCDLRLPHCRRRAPRRRGIRPLRRAPPRCASAIPWTKTGPIDRARGECRRQRPWGTEPEVHDPHQRVRASFGETWGRNDHSTSIPAVTPSTWRNRMAGPAPGPAGGFRGSPPASRESHQRGPAGGTKGTVGRHLHETAAVQAPLPKPDVAVVCEMLGPALDVASQRRRSARRRSRPRARRHVRMSSGREAGRGLGARLNSLHAAGRGRFPGDARPLTTCARTRRDDGAQEAVIRYPVGIGRRVHTDRLAHHLLAARRIEIPASPTRRASWRLAG